MKAYILHSGGLDSSVCLFLAAKQFGVGNIKGISIDYQQRHKKETVHAERICKYLGCAWEMIYLPGIPKSMLTDKAAPIPDVSYSELPEGISPTYVPFRNGLILSFLTSKVQAEGGEAIFFGAHSEDAANWAYPDCTPEFIGAMANAIYIGTYRQVRLHTPLQWLMKHEIVTLGTQLKVPLELTWSCYAGGDLHCGKCPTCRSRRAAFNLAGITDNTEYVL